MAKRLKARQNPVGSSDEIGQNARDRNRAVAGGRGAQGHPSRMTQTDDRIAILRAARRIWAVGAVHGNADRLCAVHDAMADRVRFGDRVIYLGNYYGVGRQIRRMQAELLRFRCWLLSIPPYMNRDDVIYLRGAQEEMWQKLMQLQFAPKPEAILDWVLERGAGQTMEAFGIDPQDGYAAAQEGTVALTAWTGGLRDAMYRSPGQEPFLTQLRQAAVSDNGQLLFVHTGLDVLKPLGRQSDTFWWAGRCFRHMERPYGDFRRVIRGYDPEHRGYAETEHSLTVDGGCGFGGTLMAVCLGPEGQVEDMINY